jgi:hypothetical protein
MHNFARQLSNDCHRKTGNPKPQILKISRRDVLEAAVKLDGQLAEAYTNLGVALQVAARSDTLLYSNTPSSSMTLKYSIVFHDPERRSRMACDHGGPLEAAVPHYALTM